MNHDVLDGKTVLVNTSHENHYNIYQMLSPLSRNNICVSFKRPAENMQQILTSLSVLNATFIDGISHQIQESTSFLKIENPADHEEIMNKIEVVVARTPGSKNLIIDSIDNLSKYQSEESLLDLIRFISQRTKKLGISTFILHRPENLSYNFPVYASRICDETISLP
jgi:midasin (ATPase involved in ribosome maturation)